MFFRLLPLSLLVASGAAAETIQPDFSQASFSGSAVNPFFPLDAAGVRTYRAEGLDEDGEAFVETSEMSVVGPGPAILGVSTVTVLDRAFESGVLVEETLDYYATDDAGNVWYFGEDVTNYVYDGEGQLVETNSNSAWMAGVDGALPGWMMPAVPVEGLSYFQELAAANGALDQALVWRTGETVEIAGLGIFTGVLVTYETSAFDPDLREFKYYAPGTGLIRADEGLSPDRTDPRLVFQLQPAPVPVPGALPLGLAALGAFGVLAGWRRREPGPA